jgi:stage III sporulation protein AB
MIKIIGIIALVMSGVSGGFAVSEKYTRRVNFLRQFTDLILSLKTEIRYSGKPLYEILKSYSCEEPLSSYIIKCTSCLKEKSFGESWKGAFADSAEKSGVLGEEAEIIMNFGNELGNCDIEGQINYLDHNLSIIKNYLSEAMENRKSKGKLPIILGAGLSLSVALLFI